VKEPVRLPGDIVSVQDSVSVSVYQPESDRVGVWVYVRVGVREDVFEGGGENDGVFVGNVTVQLDAERVSVSVKS